MAKKAETTRVRRAPAKKAATAKSSVPKAKAARARKEPAAKREPIPNKREPIPNKRESPLHHGFLIHDVSRLRRTVFDQRVKPIGLTRSQAWVLTNLSRHDDDALTQIELARLLDVGKVTLGGLIDRLEENGFVVRRPDPDDRRSKRISVSAKGKALVAEMEQIALEVNEACMAGVNPQQQRVLVDVLRIMKRNLIALNAVPDSTQKRAARADDE
jgi:DNA-binding MarR family transcriptional regulator